MKVVKAVKNKLNKTIIMLSAAFLILMLFSGAVYADNVYDSLTGQKSSDTQSDLSEVYQTPESKTWVFVVALFKLVFGTLVIIAIIYYGAKLIASKRRGFQPNQRMQTLAALGVAQNKTVQMIRVGSRIYLVGVGDDVQLMKEFSLEESAQIIESFDDNSVESDQIAYGLSTQFDKIFKNKLSDFKSKNESPQHIRKDHERESL